MCVKTKVSAVLFLLFVFASTAHADDDEGSRMTARIDALLQQTWAKVGAKPAPTASDAEFHRRAHLDLTGIIPNVIDVREFLQDTSSDKRTRLIERLLSKPRFATHFSTIWKNVMLPADANVRRFGGDNGFQTWLRGQFADNVPYNKMVNDLILANGASNQISPALFYTALQLKPEEVAASTSRIFLGTQIQCAQCHDHPFDHWTKKDFWGYAAFFARLQRPRGTQQVAFQVSEGDSGEVKFPDTDEVVPPRFLGGGVSLDGKNRRRVRLAKWLTANDNPFFARATVNRVWSLLFGHGIVDPVDDLGEHNPPSHPKLLDELAEYFVETDFDLKRLIRTMANTKAYRLSSESLPNAEDRPELFARMAIKSLTAEQLYDCFAEAMRRREDLNPAAGRLFGGRGFNRNRQAFLAKFRAPTQGATEYQAGIPQALTLMNGAIIKQATDLGQSDLLAALEAPFFTDEKRVEVLFLSTLSRMPNEKERIEFVEYVKIRLKGGAIDDRRKALGDILWALLNSAEFVLNH